MRILVISNLYPPAIIGGYEMGCAHQVSLLRNRGHEVVVLTSTMDAAKAPPETGVHRVLPITFERPGAWQRLRREVRSQRAARRVIRQARPDVVYVFNGRFVSRSILFIAREAAPVVYFVSDPWFRDQYLEDEWVTPWERLAETQRPLRRIAAKLLRAFVSVRLARTRLGPRDCEHVLVSSNAVRQDAVGFGRPVASAPIIHVAVDVQVLAPRPPVDRVERFLYVGQLRPEKGVRTALVAFAQLVRSYPDRPLHLTIVGARTDSAYATELEAFVQQSGLTARVTFAGVIGKELLPAVYADHDALIFPSEWDEPFALVLIEAMAVGLPIVSTMTGGTPEIVVAGHNALTFDAGDASACRAQMERLFDVDLARRLQVAARATVDPRFSIDVMVDAVEAYLTEVAAPR